MIKRKVVLFVFCFWMGFSAITAAQDKAPNPEVLSGNPTEEADSEKKTGELEFEVVEVARVSIVSDAAWRCDKAFDPPVLTIKAGTMVEWTNLDREMHSVLGSTGNQPCYLKAKPFSERVIHASQLPYKKKYRKQFNEPGEYQYACHLPSHHMAGKIIVTP